MARSATPRSHRDIVPFMFELVPEPVKEGGQWAVVWRKQAMRAVSRTAEMETSTIRSSILDERIRKAVEDPAAEKLIDGTLASGSTLVVDADENGEIVLN